MDKIIGRDIEKSALDEVYLSRQAELVAVYGRRRVGKTYLIKHHYQKKNCIYFQITGIKNGALNIQLERFSKVLGEAFYPGIELKPPASWMSAFEQLTSAINNIPKNKKIVLFFDEFPWLATRKSGAIQALEYFWNQYWVDDKRIKLVICGSSSAWIINKVVKNKGGLHNRVTKRIRLMPFSLNESMDFLSHLGIQLTRRQMLKFYMAVGGVPHYLKQSIKRYSVDQNINKLFFNSNGVFYDEFDEVFSSLFDESESYKELITIMSKSKGGILRSELEKKNKLTGKGGYLTKRLDDLESSGFISSYIPFSHKRRGTCYKLIDEYCLFYLKWVEPVKSKLKHDISTNYWLNIINTPAYYNWSGYAFENICYKHIGSIKRALNIPESALGSPWHYFPSKGSKNEGAQIDLLFDRPDQAITLCKLKYTEKQFVIDKQYANNLKNKVNVFQGVTKTRKQIFIAMISANGIKKNQYAKELISGLVTLDDLFQDS